jgi:hypothetical protein
VALDRCDDVRPFIEAAKPTHPSLVDEKHSVADLYHFVNVPSIVWIDESGKICRPVDNQFGTDTFKLQPAPSAASQLARAERALAWHLHQGGREEAAKRHFARAGELAPTDWNIRRGTMPILGEDPFGPEFFKLAEGGRAELPMEAVTPTREEA